MDFYNSIQIKSHQIVLSKLYILTQQGPKYLYIDHFQFVLLQSFQPGILKCDQIYTDFGQ